MIELKFTIYDIYRVLKETLREDLLGNTFLVFESLEEQFDPYDEDDVLALNPTSYTLKGSYGRDDAPETVAPSLQKIDKKFSLTFYPEDTLDVLRVKFIDILDGLAK